MKRPTDIKIKFDDTYEKATLILTEEETKDISINSLLNSLYEKILENPRGANDERVDPTLSLMDHQKNFPLIFESKISKEEYDTPEIESKLLINFLII